MMNTKSSTLVRYHVLCGGRTTTEKHEFVVVVKLDDMSLMVAMGYVFDRFKCKTSEDLPKPFNMTLVENGASGYEQVEEVFAESKKNKKAG